MVAVDSLPRFGVSKELSHDEYSRRLRFAKDLDVAKLRLSLFEDAKVRDLVHKNSQLVMRRKVGGGKSVVEKHVEDIWLLVCSIKDKYRVLRVLLKNGKRCKEVFELCQSNSSQANNSVFCSIPNHLVDQSLTTTMLGSPTNICNYTSNINTHANTPVDCELPNININPSVVVPANRNLLNSHLPTVSSGNDQLFNSNQGTSLTNAVLSTNP